jgi:hypothetical protein
VSPAPGLPAVPSLDAWLNLAATAFCSSKRAHRTKNPWIHIPLGYAKTYVDPSVNWKFETEPQPQMQNRSLYLPRGKTLGGSSSINGMLYIRRHHAGYDEWRQRGCIGWDWDSVLAYFKKPGIRREAAPITAPKVPSTSPINPNATNSPVPCCKPASRPASQPTPTSMVLNKKAAAIIRQRRITDVAGALPNSWPRPVTFRTSSHRLASGDRSRAGVSSSAGDKTNDGVV